MPAWTGPMTIGQILDRTWRLLKSQWKLYVALGAVPMGAMVLLEAGLIGGLFAAGLFPTLAKSGPLPPAENARLGMIMAPLIVVLDAVFLVIYAWYQSAACYAALEANGGRETTFGESMRQAGRRVGRYAWLGFVKAVCIGFPLMACAALMGAIIAFSAATRHGMPSSADILFVLLFALTFIAVPVYGIWMALKLSLAFPACIRENLTAIESIKRSNKLTRGAKGRVFVVMLVVYALTYAVMMAVEIAGMIVFMIGSLVVVALHVHWNAVLIGVCIAVGGLAVLALFLVLTGLSLGAVAIALAVLYDDQRARLEPVAQAQREPA